jgi:hypothetical protein
MKKNATPWGVAEWLTTSIVVAAYAAHFTTTFLESAVWIFCIHGFTFYG